MVNTSFFTLHTKQYNYYWLLELLNNDTVKATKRRRVCTSIFELAIMLNDLQAIFLSGYTFIIDTIAQFCHVPKEKFMNHFGQEDYHLVPWYFKRICRTLCICENIVVFHKCEYYLFNYTDHIVSCKYAGIVVQSRHRCSRNECTLTMATITQARVI